MYRLDNRFFAALMATVLSLFASGCMQANATIVEYAFPVVSLPLPQALTLTRITGADMPQTTRFGVAGTDLCRPFVLENNSTGYLCGDTFTGSDPDDPNQATDWRSPVMLRSNQTPIPGQPLEFDSAAGLAGDGIAPEIMDNGHKSGGEYTVIPTDGISFPETGEEIVSYMSISQWTDRDDPAWENNYAGLAWSPDGNHFYRIGPVWEETASHDSPFQVWSMQRDGPFVYIITVQAGRRPSPEGHMDLLRVPWNSMLDQSMYTCWNGANWGTACQPILTGSFGEPSLRLLRDGTWMMSYLDASRPDHPAIVTRYAQSPTDGWSQPKVQITGEQLPRVYAGFPHPSSTKDNVIFFVSTYQPHKQYGVLIFKGTL
ncbi:MAG: hypothetical protein JWN75_396 [Candidatus Saccharibacteria bacterium]|nr:hypothetical protein [Candidatus Saccharibacteria bacterium]